MAIAQTGAAAAASATGTLAGATGDLMIASAYNGTSTTIPTLPTGWTNIATGSLTSVALRLAFRVRQAGDAGPVFTSATRVNIVSYSGFDTGTPTGITGGTTGTSTTPTWPAMTLQITSGTSWVLVACSAIRPDVVIPAPSGTTLRDQSGIQPGFLTADTNGGVASWASHNSTVSRSDGWVTSEVEIRAAAVAATSRGKVINVNQAVVRAANW